jgi:hypothetical protein
LAERFGSRVLGGREIPGHAERRRARGAPVAREQFSNRCAVASTSPFHQLSIVIAHRSPTMRDYRRELFTRTNEDASSRLRRAVVSHDSFADNTVVLSNIGTLN